jgi:phosphate transport system substrate-binding protein
MTIRTALFGALAAATLVFAPATQAADITGAGATFPFPIYAKWAEAYKKDTGIGLNYQSIGSGGGIRQIRAKTVDFGATDAPLSGAQLTELDMVQFPTVLGGVVPVINVPGIQSGQLKLTGEMLADIYLGKITKWNDPRLVALNAGVKLPDATITPVYRSDGSGTTFIFTTYLGHASADWKGKIGANTSVSWPVGVGGRGNEGVAGSVRQLANSIGYVEFAYAKQNKIPYAQLENRNKKFVAPDDLTFQAAAANADWSAAPGFGIDLTNQPGDQSWPITGATFILMYAKPDKPDQSVAVLKFFDWAFKNGDAMAAELDYVALPAALKDQIRKVWRDRFVGANNAKLFN